MSFLLVPWLSAHSREMLTQGNQRQAGGCRQVPAAPLGGVWETGIFSVTLCHYHSEDHSEKRFDSLKLTSTAGYRELNLMPRNASSMNLKQPVLLRFLPHGIRFGRSRIKSPDGRPPALLVPNTLQRLGRELEEGGLPSWPCSCSQVGGGGGGKPLRKFVGPNTAVVVTESLDLPQTR